jgi:hypothetical protein
MAELLDSPVDDSLEVRVMHDFAVTDLHEIPLRVPVASTRFPVDRWNRKMIAALSCRYMPRYTWENGSYRRWNTPLPYKRHRDRA